MGSLEVVKGSSWRRRYLLRHVSNGNKIPVIRFHISKLG